MENHLTEAPLGRALTALAGLAALAALAALACADGIEPVSFQGISGQITYLGAAPDSTEWVRLVVYRQLPEAPEDLLGFAAFSDTLPLGAPASSFLMSLPEGSYAWLPVVWKLEGAPLGPEGLRVMGWYTAGAGPFDAPLPVIVEADRETAGVDLVASFDTLLTVEQVLERLR